MNINFILTVYREAHSGSPIKTQYHNFDDMIKATAKADQLKSDRWVRKIELSVIIHTWSR